MSWQRLFASSVEQKLATRLVIVLVLPLLGLAVLATQQLNRSTLEFTQQHLKTEAKDYGMLIAERLHNAIDAEKVIKPEAHNQTPLSLVVREEKLFVTLPVGGGVHEKEIPLWALTHDLNDVDTIRRCVSLDPHGCAIPEDTLNATWQLRLLTLYNTDTSVYVSTWIRSTDTLLEDSLLMELFPYFTALLLVIAAYSGALFLRSRLEPLSDLKAATQALQNGELGYQIDNTGDDEFSDLGNAFNAMSNELRDAFGFQRVIADIDEEILSGSELKSVFNKSAYALQTHCNIDEAIFVEAQQGSWRIFKYHDSRYVDELTSETEPRIEDYFDNGQAFPILYDQSIAGWLFIESLNQASELRVLEIIRKVAVGVVNTRKSEALYTQANYDGLTGLLNRTSFSFGLARKIARVKRTNNSGILIFLDLDSFKKVNDSEGHSAGDYLLKIIGQRLESNVREEDIVARLGGDEFAIALDAVADEIDLINFLRRLINDIEVPIKAGNLEVPIKASLGVCVFPRDGDSVDGLLKNSDIAMYRAKREPGSSFVFYDNTLNEEAERQILIESKLSRAIDNNQIELYLQPKLDLRTGQITSAEALSRWTDEDMGFIPPDEFIAIAERTGQIQALTSNIFYNVGNLLKHHETSLQRIAINISPRELDRVNFTTDLIQLLAQSDVNNHTIELEVTESNFMDDPLKVATVLHTLRDTGMQISLDDFGTGYSSLNLLRQLPLDYLKIDKSFIDEIMDQSRAHDLVEKIIDIAKGLGMGVVAEGVETQEQLNALENMSCDYAQGYLVSKPLPAAEAIAFINNWNEQNEPKVIQQLF